MKEPKRWDIELNENGKLDLNPYKEGRFVEYYNEYLPLIVENNLKTVCLIQALALLETDKSDNKYKKFTDSVKSILSTYDNN